MDDLFTDKVLAMRQQTIENTEHFRCQLGPTVAWVALDKVLERRQFNQSTPIGCFDCFRNDSPMLGEIFLVGADGMNFVKQPIDLIVTQLETLRFQAIPGLRSGFTKNQVSVANGVANHRRDAARRFALGQHVKQVQHRIVLEDLLDRFVF